MSAMNITKEGARKFLIARQGFGQYEGKTGALKAIRQLECIQIDPVRVVQRNHHLVLHNRVRDYQPSYLETLLYRDRALFEYWCNGKSIIPIEDFRYFSYQMEHCMEFHSPFYERLKARRAIFKEASQQVLSTIEAEGPLCARDFKEVDSKTATRVFHLLWDNGKVMIHHVEGNRRYYDLTSRILPDDLDKPLPSREEYECFMIEKYMRAYGLVDVRDWRFGWLKLKSAQRKHLAEQMVNEGRLHPVKIKGVTRAYYILDEYVSQLNTAKDARIDETVYFIAPLDNFIWNRKTIAETFNFDYAWEIYKPPEKRRYGYYTMPILYGANLVGRMDPKINRADKTMILNSVILKDEMPTNFPANLVIALSKFMLFHNALRLKIVKTKPKTLKNAVLHALNPNSTQ